MGSQKATPTTTMKFAKSFALAAAALVGCASAIELEEGSTCNTATTGECAAISTAQAAIDALTAQPSSFASGDALHDNLVNAYTAAVTAKCDCAINGAESLTLSVAA